MSADEALGDAPASRILDAEKVEIGVVIAMGPVADPAGAYGVAIIEAPSADRARGDVGVGPGDPVEDRIFVPDLSHARDRGAAEPAARPDQFRNSLTQKGACGAIRMAIEIRVPALGGG